MPSHTSRCLYAIFSGQNGYKVAEFAIQRISAEILFGQLSGCSPEEVKEVLRFVNEIYNVQSNFNDFPLILYRQAFISVERDYLQSIDSLLAQKAKFQCEIPDGMSHYEVASTLLFDF